MRVDEALDDEQSDCLGDADWQVVRSPGHTPGHLALWEPEEKLLVVGDSLSDYDVGWVNLALDGPDAAATALRSLPRLAALDPRVVLPSHGPLPGLSTESLATELAASMTRSGALVIREGRVKAAAEYAVVNADAMRVPFPREWS